MFTLEICSEWEVSVPQAVQVVAGLYERGMGTDHGVCREGIAESCEDSNIVPAMSIVN
jgi:hypothetical protein